MYSDVFCKVYNEFGWNYYPEIFGTQLLQWLTCKGVSPKTALDLACGTGVLCRILANEGMQVWGMDLSEGMIDIARGDSRDITYEVADMTTYRPDRQFQLVTCTGDAVNHLPSLSDVEKMFRNVYAYTAPGGWFVFDLLNENEVSDSEPFEMDYDEHTRVWFQMTRPAPLQVNLTIRVFENGVLAFEEVISETLHDVQTICDLLRRVGFQSVQCADRLLEDSGHGTTWFVTAQK